MTPEHLFTARSTIASVALLALGPASFLAAEPNDLQFMPGSHDTLTWSPALSDEDVEYGLRQGRITQGGRPADAHCVQTRIQDAFTRFSDMPQPGEAYFFEVTGIEVLPDGTVLSNPFNCGPRVYARAGALGRDDGSDWENAYTTLQRAVVHPAQYGQLEVWISGEFTAGADAPESADHFTFLGGFHGSESRLWERDPHQWPTVVHGGIGASHGYGALPAHIRIDGLTLESVSVSTMRNQNRNSTLLIARSLVSSASSAPTVYFRSTEAEGTLTIRDSTIVGGSGGAVFVHGDSGAVMAEISRTALSFQRGPVITLLDDAAWWGPGWSGPSHLRLQQSSLSGGTGGVLVSSRTDEVGSSVHEYASAEIASSVFSGINGPVLDLQASIDTCPWPSDSRSAYTSLVATNNTFAHNGGPVVSCTVHRACTWPFAPSEGLSCTATIWNNIIAHNGGYALQESADDEEAGVISDIISVRNDLFGNGALMLDEGTTVVSTISELNVVSGCAENIDGEPLFRGSGEHPYVLSHGSPAIDFGGIDAPLLPEVDRLGRNRVLDGNQDGLPFPDLGAYEFDPLSAVP